MFTILIPTDYSRCATNAIRYALALTKRLQCRIIFFHGELIPAPPNADISVIPVEMDRDTVQKLLMRNVQRTLKSMNMKADDTRFNYIVSDGVSVSQQILDTIIQWNVDLVIMGTQGASGIAKYLLGSNTVTVINKSKTPVITIPSSYRFKPLKKIMHASDLDDLNKELNVVLPWAKLFNASLEVLHLSNESDAEMKLVSKSQQLIRRKSYKKIKLVVSPSAPGKSIADQLKSMLKKQAADMVIMFRHERNWLGKIFLQSETDRLAFETDIPLLAFHAE